MAEVSLTMQLLRLMIPMATWTVTVDGCTTHGLAMLSLCMMPLTTTTRLATGAALTSTISRQMTHRKRSQLAAASMQMRLSAPRHPLPTPPSPTACRIGAMPPCSAEPASGAGELRRRCQRANPRGTGRYGWIRLHGCICPIFSATCHKIKTSGWRSQRRRMPAVEGEVPALPVPERRRPRLASGTTAGPVRRLSIAYYCPPSRRTKSAWLRDAGPTLKRALRGGPAQPTVYAIFGSAS